MLIIDGMVIELYICFRDIAVNNPSDALFEKNNFSFYDRLSKNVANSISFCIELYALSNGGKPIPISLSFRGMAI